MPQLENIEAIEERLWKAADQIRANSIYASNEHLMPVMGLIFLRYAYSCFLNMKDEIEASLSPWIGKKRARDKGGFSEKCATYLQPEAQFDCLVGLGDKDEIKRNKGVAFDLLAALKEEKLKVAHRREKESTRDTVRLTIYDFPWSVRTGPPVDSYEEQEVLEKVNDAFRHVYRVCPKIPCPMCSAVA